MHMKVCAGIGREGGRGVGSGWLQLLILLLPTRLDDMDSVFLRPPWDRGGRGEGSGKWMVATFSSVVADAPR